MRFVVLAVLALIVGPKLHAAEKGKTSSRAIEFVEKKEKAKLEKIPKSMFLIKRTKINADVGEPQFYPADAQLRTVINDPTLHDTKNFE
jgi:hypothetical protein